MDDLLDFINSQNHSDDQLDQVLQTYQTYTESQSPTRHVNAHIDTIYIKTQVFRLLGYYSPAPRNIARSDWATQNITHNMTSSKT